jgi:acyl-CoA synthetase (NDP forming)
MGVQLMASAEERHGGIGKFVGIGNEALFTSTDLFDFFADDAQTGLILDYVEGMDEGRRFMEAAREAARKKPVIVLRGGASESGAKAAASHTGAMAGSQRVFEAVVRQSGIIATTDPDEFIDLTFALSYLPLPRGRRVAVVTMGGGWGVVSADEIDRSGLALAELKDEDLAELDKVLPPYWSHSNPVDLVGSIKDGAAERAVEVVTRSESVDAVVALGIIGMVTSPLRVIDEVNRVQERSGIRVGGENLPDPEKYRFREGDYIRWCAELMRAYRKPIVNVSVRPIQRAVFGEGGPYSTVVLPSPLRSVRVIAQMAGYAAVLERMGVLDERQ